MGWRLWKRVKRGRICKAKREQEGLFAGCFRPSRQQEEYKGHSDLEEVEHPNLEQKAPPGPGKVQPSDVREEDEAVGQEQDREEAVKFRRMRWVPVKQRRRMRCLDCVRCFRCCRRAPDGDEEAEEDEQEYLRKLSDVWSRRNLSDSDCIPFKGENKMTESDIENPSGDQSRSQDYKREAICSLASYVKNAALTLHQEKLKLRRVHCELQNIEEICKQLVQFILEDGGAHWREYESLFLLFMVMVKPLFHRILQCEEWQIMIKVIKNLREYIDEIMLHARRIIGFFSSGEQETVEYFMKTSKEWLRHFEGNDESSSTDDPYLSVDEDIHLKYSYLTQRLRKNRTSDIKEKILGLDKDKRKDKNIEESDASNNNQVKLAEHPFRDVISYYMKPEHPPDPKGLFMEFYLEVKSFNEMPQKLYMLQTMMIYIVDTQKKVQRDEARILKVRDEFENIEETLIQVMDFICEDQGASTTQVYENKLLKIKRVTQPIFCHVVQQEEWPKMLRMMRIIKSLCYRMVYRIQRWHFLNMFSQDMIGRMKIFLDDVSDWMVDVGDKINAFETCERIEESQRLNNLLPDNEALYLRIIRRIQKLKENDTDAVDVWMSCLYHRDLGFTRPIFDNNELSSDDESCCDGVANWWKLVGTGVATETYQLKASTSVHNEAIDASCCYSHTVSISDLPVLNPSGTDDPKESGANKENSGQGDTCATEKVEAKLAENPASNLVLDIVKSDQCKILDMTIVMWLCALFYFWKHLAGLD